MNKKADFIFATKAYVEMGMWDIVALRVQELKTTYNMTDAEIKAAVFGEV